MDDVSRANTPSVGDSVSRGGSKQPGRGDDEELDLFARLGQGPAGLFSQQVQTKQPRGYHLFLSRPSAWQRQLIQRPWQLPVIAMHLAAVVLQRAWRRNWLCHTKPSSATGRARSFPISRPKRVSAQRASAPQVLEALRQRYFDILRRRCDEAALAAAGSNVAVQHSAAPYPTFDNFCAALIQGRWRSYCQLRIARRVLIFRELKLYHVAAFEIQRAWSETLQRRLDTHLNGEAYAVELAERRRAKRCDSAVRRLQRAWRSTINYRIYESLRDTIRTFRRSGDPFLLMRSVLPREAMLLDPAMQVHVRFRLGGARFPPSIYYKIYTHGAICDLGSFAPRNYAAERIVGLDMPSKQGWYEREENNGWRPIAIRLSPGVDRLRDEVERASDRKVVKEFHFSRLRRRQDLDRKKKKRTLEWMQKMYGLLPPAPEAGIAEDDLARDYRAEEENFAAKTWPANFIAAGAPGALGGAARLQNLGFTGHVPQAPVGAPPANRFNRQRPPSRTLVGADGSSPGSSRCGDERPSDMSARTPSPPLESRSDAPDRYVDQYRAAPGNSGTARYLTGGSNLSSAHKLPAPMPGASAAAAMEEDPMSDEMLLEWSRRLDFDAYMESWKRTATSDGSEGALPISTVAHTRALAPATVH